MEPANRENGGLVIYPGTHKGNFVKHGYPEWKDGVNRGYWGIIDMPSDDSKFLKNIKFIKFSPKSLPRHECWRCCFLPSTRYPRIWIKQNLKI